jgi:hypothetical protein
VILLFYIGAVHHTVSYTAECGRQILLTGSLYSIEQCAALRLAVLHGLMVVVLACQNLRVMTLLKVI